MIGFYNRWRGQVCLAAILAAVCVPMALGSLCAHNYRTTERPGYQPPAFQVAHGPREAPAAPALPRPTGKNVRGSTGEPQIDFDDNHWLRLYLGGQCIWSADAAEPRAIFLRHSHLVIYATGGDGLPSMSNLEARSVDGKVQWDAEIAEEPARIECAGGDWILLTHSPPDLGHARQTTSDSDAQDMGIAAFNLRRRRVDWDSDVQQIGLPIWTNGSVFLTLRSSTPAGRRARNKGVTPASWLEERSMQSRKVLWRTLVGEGGQKAPILLHNAGAPERLPLELPYPLDSVRGHGPVVVPIDSGGIRGVSQTEYGWRLQ